MNQQAIDQIKAERDELRKRARLYEELRQATDGGSESMTHEDAIEHVKALAAENKVLREDAERYRWLRNQPNDTSSPSIDVCYWFGDGDNVDGIGLRTEELDEVIDAALTKEAK